MGLVSCRGLSYNGKKDKALPFEMIVLECALWGYHLQLQREVDGLDGPAGSLEPAINALIARVREAERDGELVRRTRKEGRKQRREEGKGEGRKEGGRAERKGGRLGHLDLVACCALLLPYIRCFGWSSSWIEHGF